MKNLVFMLYANKYDVVGERLSLSWGEWCDIFTTHETRGTLTDSIEELKKNKDGPCVVLGKIIGRPRCKKNVMEIYALGLDFDSATDAEIDRALATLAAFNYVLYSTYNHGSTTAGGVARLRIIVPLEDWIPPDGFEAAWRALFVMTGEKADAAAKDASRLYYLPSTFNPEKAFSDVHTTGRWLSLQDLAPFTRVQKTSMQAAADRVRLSFVKVPKGHKLYEAARAVLAGRPFAPPGERHETARALTWWLACRPKRFAEEDVCDCFIKSVEAMKEITVDDVLGMYRTAVEKIDAEKKVKADTSQLHGLEPYSDAELDAIAERQGYTRETLGDKWILQRKDIFYALGEEGDYDGPIFLVEARPALAQILARAPVRLNEPTKSGVRRRTVAEVVEDHGQRVREIVFDLTREFSWYDSEGKTLYDATQPIRKTLAPVFDETFDQFLKIFAGDLYEKLCDWIACCPDNTKVLCALYLAGPPGVGKGLVTTGLAKLWHTGDPTALDNVIGAFNQDLTHCPLVLADEALPHQWRWDNVTTRLRSMISAYQHTLCAKHMPPSVLVGALRLVLAANNDGLLKSAEVMTPDDHEAIGQRFLYIEIPPAAAEFLTNVSATLRDKWAERGIAEYALWLRKNRNVERGRRFWVEGDVSRARCLLLTGSDFHEQVNYWLVGYLMNPIPIDAKGDGLVRIQKGQMLVNVQAIIDGWETYISGKNAKLEPVIGRVNKVLRQIASKEQVQLRFNGKQIRYRTINRELLFAWSEKNGVGDQETMEVTLGLREKPNIAAVTDDLASLRRKEPQTARERIEGKTDPNEKDEGEKPKY